MAQDPVEAAAIAGHHALVQVLAPALQARLPCLCLGLEPARAEHRRQGQGNHQRDNDRHRQGDGELAEQRADDTAHEQDRDKHHHQRQVHRQQGEADFLGAQVGSAHRRHAFVDMPGDVLQHHDGIVHHQAGGENQRHQRHVVQREAAQVHGREGADQRHRHRQGRNQRGTQVAEEQEHHEDHQHHGDDQGVLGFLEGRLDHRRAIHGHVQLDAGRHQRLQGRQLLLDLVHGLDDVGASLAVDHQQHRVLVIEEATVVAVLHRVGDLGHMAQAQYRTVLVTDHQWLVVLGLFQLVVGLHLPAALRVFDKTLGPALVGVGDGLAHIVQRHAVLIEQLRFEFDAHRRQRTAADLHLAYPRYLGQALRQDGRGQVVELALLQHAGGQRQDHDRRLRRVELLVGRHAAHTAGQQVARGVDRRLHFTRGRIDISALVKAENHPGRALAGIAGERGDPGYRAHGALQRGRHG
ncbi:hypothetical protein D3C78_857760 [compost metagenome]